MTEMSINSINDIFFIGVENQKPSTSIEITNAIIKNAAEIVKDFMNVWKKNDFYDDDLWKIFREIFESTNITEEKFEKMNKIKFRKFRKFLRQRDVWVYNGSSLFVSRVFLEVLAEDFKSTWFELKIKDRDYAEEFTFSTIRNFLKVEEKRKKRK